jgi:glycosyltransferase involved in cell wall biosynthesis
MIMTGMFAQPDTPCRTHEPPLDLSVVVPVCNEFDNIVPMHAAVREAIEPTGLSWELIFINDGSRDGSDKRLDELAGQDARVRVIHLRRNFGQSAAMDAGILMARGDVIATLDGDLQNDPGDIPMMLERLHEGYDLVHGWRRHRQDTFLDRKLPSKIANWLISRVTRVPVHDLGCALKVMRREIAEELRLQGEMHRYITILAHARGARCLEVETRHHARKFGKTKYGISRTFRVIQDLITVKYLLDYQASPMRLFGTIGGICGLISVVALMATLILKLTTNFDMTGNPLLLLGTTSGIGAIQFISLGLLGEMTNRTYHEARGIRPYAVRRFVNFDQSSGAQSQDAQRSRAA